MRYTFFHTVFLEKFKADNDSHDLGKTCNLPLIIFPNPYNLLIFRIIKTPIGSGNSLIEKRYTILSVEKHFHFDMIVLGIIFLK